MNRNEGETVRKRVRTCAKKIPEFGYNSIQDWISFIKNEEDFLSNDNNTNNSNDDNDAKPSKEYIDFKNGVLQNKYPQDLLFLTNSFTKKDLDIAYRNLARNFHPDKNPNRIIEAESLFKILGKAKEMLLENAS
jgi:hypothetical protein